MLILAAVFYTRYFLARPIGSGPVGPQVDGAAFSTVWTERPVCLIGLGDSITAGLGAASPDHTFFRRLVENPDDEYLDMRGKCLSRVLPNLGYENLVVSGTTSKDHLTVIDERLKRYDAEVFGLVVMTTGGNDLIHSYGRSPPRECRTTNGLRIDVEQTEQTDAVEPEVGRASPAMSSFPAIR